MRKLGKKTHRRKPYKDPDIIITVEGKPGTGKSAIARFIAEMLYTAGVDGVICDDNGLGYKGARTRGDINRSWRARIRAIVKQRRTVRIHTQLPTETRWGKEAFHA